ncbi:Uncharacterised protein [Chromobacterium violaceum]|uniref:Uncharacterized protein n=1 Tax=Chromobacterium violaceum TaxID=536 RepID=A0A447TKY0_CHRVL|nr:Uncharacterised protein [Chromobacterium violaceum]
MTGSTVTMLTSMLATLSLTGGVIRACQSGQSGRRRNSLGERPSACRKARENVSGLSKPQSSAMAVILRCGWNASQ